MPLLLYTKWLVCTNDSNYVIFGAKTLDAHYSMLHFRCIHRGHVITLNSGSYQMIMKTINITAAAAAATAATTGIPTPTKPHSLSLFLLELTVPTVATGV